jgi:hypothetical protein
LPLPSWHPWTRSPEPGSGPQDPAARMPSRGRGEVLFPTEWGRAREGAHRAPFCVRFRGRSVAPRRNATWFGSRKPPHRQPKRPRGGPRYVLVGNWLEKVDLKIAFVVPAVERGRLASPFRLGSETKRTARLPCRARPKVGHGCSPPRNLTPPAPSATCTDRGKAALLWPYRPSRGVVPPRHM